MLYNTNDFKYGDLQEAVEGLEEANQEAEETTDVLQNVDVQTDDDGVPENLPLTGAPVPNTDTVTTPDQYNLPTQEPDPNLGYTTQPGSKGMPTKPPAETFPTPDKTILPQEPLWKQLPVLPDGRIDTSQLNPEGVVNLQNRARPAVRSAWKLDYAPGVSADGISEFEAEQRFESQGGDSNLEATAEFFNWVRSLPPEQQAIYDRNGDGVFTVSDYLNMSPKSTLAEELADTEYWLADLKRGGIQARTHSLWMWSTEFLGEGNMLQDLILKRKRYFEPGNVSPLDKRRGELLSGSLNLLRDLTTAKERWRLKSPGSLFPAEYEGLEQGGLPQQMMESIEAFTGGPSGFGFQAKPGSEALYYKYDENNKRILMDARTGSDPKARDEEDQPIDEESISSDKWLYGTKDNRNVIQNMLYQNSLNIEAKSFVENLTEGIGYYVPAAIGMGIGWKQVAKMGGPKWLTTTPSLKYGPNLSLGGWRTLLGRNGGWKPAVRTGAEWLKTSAQSAIADTSLISYAVTDWDYGKGVNLIEGDQTLTKLVRAVPESAGWLHTLMAGLDTNPHFIQTANMIDETARDFSAAASFGLGLSGAFKGISLTPKAINKVSISTVNYIGDNWGGLRSGLKQWEARSKAMFDAAEAAKDQVNMWIEGPSSVWRYTDVRESELASTYGAYKNGPRGYGQGTIYPTGTVRDVNRGLNEISTQIVTDGGSVPRILSPLDTKTLVKRGNWTETIQRLSKELSEDNVYRREIDGLPKNKKLFGELHDLEIKRLEELMGREGENLSNLKLWEPILRNIPVDGTVPINDLPVVDALVGSLFKRIRDQSQAALELQGKTDLFATEGLIRNMADNLTLGLTLSKRARYQVKLMAEAGDQLTPQKIEEITQKLETRTQELHSETRDGVRLMMQLLEGRKDDDLITGILEVFRMSDNIHNWNDFNAWMGAKLRGGEFNGKVETGRLIREWQDVYVNSMLSGPKTPIRAIAGTGINTYYNAITEAAGASIREPFTGNVLARRIATAKLKGYFELLPEAWQIFRKNVNMYYSKDLAEVRTRYTEQKLLKDEQWKLYEAWIEAGVDVSDGDRAAFYMANAARVMNANRLLSWSPRMMGATDETFKWLLARARSKEKGIRSVLEAKGDDLAPLTKEELKTAEDIHYSHFLDKNGDIDLTKDSWLKQQFEEVTLTSELKGWAADLDNFFKDKPLLKPFYLFARTGINGLGLSYKNTPLLGALQKEAFDIFSHKGNDFTKLHQYGIENAADLTNARNLTIGRQAVGSVVAMTMINKYMNGDLTGNGPADRQLKQQWINAKWKPMIIRFGNFEFDYSSLEPFNNIFSSIADIGDNSQLMGSEWTEKRLQAVAFVLGRGLTSKTYMSGLDQLMQLIQLKPGAFSKTAADIMNNSVVLAGMRNEFGKFINPHMKELNSSVWDSIRNRNQWAEYLVTPQNRLPEKSDILNGQPLKNWNMLHRAFNAASPFQLSFESNSPGRRLLFESGYDLKGTTYSYGGYSFAKHPVIRAHFQNEMGNAPVSWLFTKYKNLEAALDAVSKDKDVQYSLATMKANRNTSKAEMDPSDAYTHNEIIDELFEDARFYAWQAINTPGHPAYDLVTEMRAAADGKRADEFKSKQETQAEILRLNNP